MRLFELKIMKSSVSKRCVSRRCVSLICKASIIGAGIVLPACQGGNITEAPAMPVINNARLDNRIAAEVNGSKIFLSDITQRAVMQGEIADGTQISEGDPVFQIMLDELIDQRLLSLEAVNRSLDQSADAKQRLLIAREGILSTILLEKHLGERVTDQAVRRMYDAQAKLRESGREVRARQIIVKDQEIADKVVKRLVDGESFSDIAAKLSLDKKTSRKGGDLGFFTRDMLAPKITRAAFELERGERSKPFETELGWHILEVTGSRRTPQPRFEDMKDEILSFMTYEEIDGLIKELRGAAALSFHMGSHATAPKDQDE